MKGTNDAFSDYEYKSRDQPKDQPENFREVYSSCKNMLFEVTAVIKNSSGKEVSREPISSLSEIFEMAMMN